MAAKKRRKAAKKRTGWSVASASGQILAEIKAGAQVWITAPGKPRNATNQVERICASALGQREAK